MQKIEIPWGQWYEQSVRILSFPDDWEVHVCRMKEAQTLSGQQIADRLDHPVGTKTLENWRQAEEAPALL